jgi:tetrachlorobenzoquinone reductase
MAGLRYSTAHPQGDTRGPKGIVSDPTLTVRVESVTRAADGINLYELRPTNGSELPKFTAGAHVDLHLPNGLIRSYSLCNAESERHRYVVGINNDRASRGGSRYIHESIKPGATLTITAPRNHFALAETAAHTVFIAGGIGITPLMSMVRRLEALGRSWEMHYSARSPEMCAFHETLAAHGERVRFNFDDGQVAKMLDLPALVARLPRDAHIYCCGPTPMIKAFEAAAAGRPVGSVHVEYFTPKEEAATGGGYVVELARMKRSFTILPGKTILDTLLDAGLDIAHSCTEGICGTCETKVIEGIPDHRDSILTPQEQAANQTMMICCSGSKSAKLVLDL